MLSPVVRLVVLLVLALVGTEAARLSVSGRDFVFNEQKVFLSGVNIAWNSYGYDFGNGAYHSNSRTILEGWLAEIAANGGNSVRIWLHIEGDNTPAYDSNGYVTGPDTGNTLISDMREFLDFAKSQNILVTFVLWNGAVLRNANTINLFWDQSKLQSYIDNALKPMVSELAGHPALGSWEIMNEPEGSVLNNAANSNPCFDTTLLIYSGAGWTGNNIPMENIQRLHNWIANAIKEVDPEALVTTGSWSEKASTDSFSDSRNYWSDQCLLAAGEKPLGTMDFVQIHSYAYNNQWPGHGPFVTNPSDYGSSKPIVIGEFSQQCGAGESIQQLYDYAYNQNYQGAWLWQYNGSDGCCDSRDVQNSALRTLQGRNGAGGLVNFSVN